MTNLKLLAEKLAVSDRTLRRAAARGTIRGWQRGRQARVELPIREILYLERAWPTIDTLIGGLRTLPSVRLAVLFGSIARGDWHDRSDLDLLVRFAEPSLRARSQLQSRIEDEAPGRPVQLVELEDANPLLLVDVIREGRVLVDRDGDWPALLARRARLEAEAGTARAELEAGVFADLEALFSETGV